MRTAMKKILPILIVAALLASCASYHLRKGDQAYALMAYAKAQHHYELALAKITDRDATIRAAEACQQQNELKLAAERFHVADSISSLSGDDALHYGRVLLGLGRYEEAAERFMTVLKEHPEDQYAMDLYGSCQGYDSFYADSSRFIVSELPLPGIKTAFCAIPYKDGLVFAGEQDVKTGRADPWNGLTFLDLYFAKKHTLATWEEALPLKGTVNGPYHEGPATFTDDGRTMYFTRSNYYDHKLGKDSQNTSHLKLFRATLDEKGEWGNIHEFSYNGEDFSTGHPALSADGKTLYFASDRPGGRGGSDIWRCIDTGTGWGEPRNLGPTVNSPGNELFPTLNGDKLYFSSTAHENMGGLDIFETHEENDRWTEPSNMGYPINTTHDDFSFVLDSTGKSGFLSSDRNGIDRVHTFWMYEPIFFVDGDVTGDSASAFLPNTVLTLIEVATNDETTMTTGPDGHFSFKLKPNSRYSLRAVHENMINESHALSTIGLSKSDTLHADFHLTSIVLDQPIAVKNIYYDYDKWDLRTDAAIELDKLAHLFMDNPQLSFELGSHTDSRGGDIYNLVLSDMRANTAVDYLIRKGVDPQHITAKGYGETMLVNKCRNGVSCTEEDHQQNRRTEFKVTNVKELAQKH